MDNNSGRWPVFFSKRLSSEKSTFSTVLVLRCPDALRFNNPWNRQIVNQHNDVKDQPPQDRSRLFLIGLGQSEINVWFTRRTGNKTQLGNNACLSWVNWVYFNQRDNKCNYREGINYLNASEYCFLKIWIDFRKEFQFQIWLLIQ